MAGEDERVEKLGGGIRAVVTAEHTFGADAVLLAHFAAPKKGGRLCDLGTGCGIIPLLWCRGDGPFVIDAVELQPEAAALAEKAAALNGLPVTVYCRDIRALDTSFYNRYDLVSCNPPYFAAGDLNESAAAAAARHETNGTLADFIAAGARLLKPGGCFCLCHRPERLAEIVTLMRASGLEPKRMRLVQQDRASKPWLLLMEGRRGGRPGLTALPVLIMREGGAERAELREIYGNYSD